MTSKIVVNNIEADAGVSTVTVSDDVSIADKIVHTGDTNTAIRFPAADTISFETAGNDRLRIDSSGRLGVGVNSFHDTSTRLQLQSPGSDHTGIVITAAATSTLSYIYFGDTADKDIGRLVYENSSDSMQFWTNNAERLRIDSSGRILIGTTTEGASGADQFTVASSSHGGITIRSGSTSNGNLMFSDGTSGAAEYAGFVQYEHDNNKLNIGSNGSTKLSIDSTGRISSGKHGVGTYNDASEWFKVQSDDSAANISIVGSNDTHSSLNMGDEDDFNIQKIKSDHTNNSLQFFTNNVERVRVNSSGTLLVGATSYGGGGTAPALYVSNSGGRQVKIHNTNANTTSIQLTNATSGEGEDGGMMFATLGGSADGWINNAENAAIRFGTNGNERMRILAGGGLTFNGDTATANALDDYEEGSWTPTAQSGASGITVYASRYTKIGNKVFIDFRGLLTGTNGGNVQIGGLPFANLGSDAHNIGPIMHNGFDYAGGTEPVATSYITGTNAYFQLYYSQTNSNGWQSVTGSDTGGDQFITSLTYFTS